MAPDEQFRLTSGICEHQWLRISPPVAPDQLSQSAPDRLLLSPSGSGAAHHLWLRSSYFGAPVAPDLLVLNPSGSGSAHLWLRISYF